MQRTATGQIYNTLDKNVPSHDPRLMNDVIVLCRADELNTHIVELSTFMMDVNEHTGNIRFSVSAMLCISATRGRWTNKQTKNKQQFICIYVILRIVFIGIKSCVFHKMLVVWNKLFGDVTRPSLISHQSLQLDAAAVSLSSLGDTSLESKVGLMIQWLKRNTVTRLFVFYIFVFVQQINKHTSWKHTNNLSHMIRIHYYLYSLTEIYRQKRAAWYEQGQKVQVCSPAVMMGSEKVSLKPFCSGCDVRSSNSAAHWTFVKRSLNIQTSPHRDERRCEVSLFVIHVH